MSHRNWRRKKSASSRLIALVLTLIANAEVNSAMVRRDIRTRLPVALTILIDGRCAGFRVVELNDRAGIEEISSQRSTFPAFGNNSSGHRSWNLGETPSDFLQT